MIEKSTLLKKRGAATRPRGATPTKKEAPIKAPTPAKGAALDPKKGTSSSGVKPATRGKGASAAKTAAQDDEHESIEMSSQ